MSAAPRVSIVLPNYNYARYLDERIRTLLDQDFYDFELIIVDDASSDHSRDVIGTFAGDPRVRTQFHETNSGHTYRRWNDGAALARGELLLFAGADDSCAPQLLSTLVSMLDEHRSCAVAHARAQVIDPDGNPLHLRPSEARWDQDFVAGGDEEAVHLLTGNTIPNASGALMRRTAFEAAGGFDLRLHLSADHLLWARMLRGSAVAYTAAPLNRWRTHPSTVRRSIGAERFIAEWYIVVGFIACAYAIDAAVVGAALQRVFDQWMTLIGSKRLSSRGSRAAVAAARVVDPDLWSRVARLPRRDLARFVRRLVVAF